MSSYQIMFLVISSLCSFALVSSYNIFHANVSYSRTSRQVQGCILPQHPSFGQWVIYPSNSQPQVGTSVPSGTVLQVNCKNEYKLDGDAVIVCINGEWSTEIGQCMKTCPPIHNTPVMTVTCTYNHRKIKDCVNALDGTKAEFRCADFYEDQSLERHPRHVCYNGKWSHNVPECVPICGQKNVKKDPTLIVGGTNVTKGDYPWQVALYHKQSKELLCGGSLINQRVVLTAAHCITIDGKLASKHAYMVAVGKYFRNFDDPSDKNEAQFSSIYEMYIPKQYKGDVQNYLGDIAVIITKKTFVLSTRVQPVCVDWASRHDYLLNPLKTKNAYVSGWGYTVEHNKPSEVLKELKVPLISEDKCTERIPEDYTRLLTDDKICAGYLESGLSVCKGDSGGGLVARYRDRFYVIAVVSVSPQAATEEGGCDSQQYALYTRVNYYIESFILDLEARFRPSFSGGLDCEDDPNCRTETSTTPQPVVQTPKRTCILPEHPPSGRWIIYGSQSQLSPGTLVSTGTIIKISCEQSHKLIGQEIILCDEQGKWSPEMPKCLKTCPPLFSNEVVSITCTFKSNETENCQEPVEGTIAKHQCAPFYEDLQLAKNPARVCRNGMWDLGKPECTPICGQKSINGKPLIVNGKVASQGAYPWHVAIYKGRSKRFTCNGALISQKVILTAGHCITTRDGKLSPTVDFTVAVGKFYRDFYDPGDTKSQSSTVEEMFIPVQYKGIKNNYVGDIGVIITKTPFKLSRSVQPVCVDWALKYDINTFVNGSISGWGYTSPNGKPSDELRELDMPIVSKDQCTAAFPEDFQNFITFDKICAGFLNQSTSICNGDAGGALVTKISGRYYVAAIASIAPGSTEGGCDTQKYSFYTKIAEYNNFILEKDAQFKPSVQSDGECPNGRNNCETTTPKPQAQNPKVPRAECILPNHPNFGKWRIYGAASRPLQPGDASPLGTILQVVCNPGYKLEGDNLILCENGIWSTNTGTCLKTCPPIQNNKILKGTCMYKGKEIEDCSDPSDGTQVKYECASYYEDQKLTRNPIHTCRDGSWDFRPPECVPVCGLKSVNAQLLIINGNTVQKGQYPWHVAVYRNPKKEFICSGTLINERVILTAAHCVTNLEGKVHEPNTFVVAAGKYYRNYNDSRDNSAISDLQDIFVPPTYRGSSSNFINNIALLVTAKPFTLSRRIQPVCVDWTLNHEKELTVNTTGYVTGWGFTKEIGNPADELQELQVPLIDNGQCGGELPKNFGQYLTYDKFCAGYLNQGKSVCNGDSGGALVVKLNGRYYVTGIVSSAPRGDSGGCNSNQYALYTKVSSHIDNFISQKVTSSAIV